MSHTVACLPQVENPQTSRGELQAQSPEVQFESTGGDGQALRGEQLVPVTRPHAEAVCFSLWPPDGAAGVAGPGGP